MRDERWKIEDPKRKAKRMPDPGRTKRVGEATYGHEERSREERADDDDEGRTAEPTALFRPVRKGNKTT